MECQCRRLYEELKGYHLPFPAEDSSMKGCEPTVLCVGINTLLYEAVQRRQIMAIDNFMKHLDISKAGGDGTPTLYTIPRARCTPLFDSTL